MTFITPWEWVIPRTQKKPMWDFLPQCPYNLIGLDVRRALEMALFISLINSSAPSCFRDHQWKWHTFAHQTLEAFDWDYSTCQGLVNKIKKLLLLFRNKMAYASRGVGQETQIWDNLTRHQDGFGQTKKISWLDQAISYQKYSRPSLNGHLYKTDTSVKRTPRVGPCLSQLPIFDFL